ncbi:DUF2332 domain-containing protein [Nocardioides daphniae]|uniref:DUF2332 domain-containing protein n=1 Tax=Nocardioides daphniae TaxID=402297 RepID=A0A4V1CWP4_9ACTN|nr:DUF2332 domain-containing protein [Nocardioides daphniae]QCC77977.1 DUF2332 domain-containing protein [Nocardioides daphniae]GGD23423.1 hypothetical protein GCM10007231_23160 [Nocardioides daphniae]
MDPHLDVPSAYRQFAEEASDSPTFSSWARAAAEDPELVAWLETLPGIKQQPNLVFAAARWHGVPAPGPYAALREALLLDDGSIRATVMARATQTNEVGRLATLLPAFAGFEGPLALLEVGAAAGLNLFPDRWGYAWETAEGTVELGDEPRLPCRVDGAAPLPDSLPEVAWRGGVDLNPLDVTDPGAMAWLAQLVWPEQDERLRRLAQAIRVAQDDPPQLVQGNLLDELPDLVARAGAHGTVVVFHTAVIAYLEPADRERFDTMMRDLVASGACHWVSNESGSVLPSVTRTGPEPDLHFVLGVDGRAVAHTHGHGRELHWFG